MTLSNVPCRWRTPACTVPARCRMSAPGPENPPTDAVTWVIFKQNAGGWSAVDDPLTDEAHHYEITPRMAKLQLEHPGMNMEDILIEEGETSLSECRDICISVNEHRSYSTLASPTLCGVWGA